MSAPKRTNSKWAPDEDVKLAELVKTHGTKNWTRISKQFNNRKGKQCRERYRNHLDPNICHDPFTEHEDKEVIRLIQEVGTRWARISELMPGRTENAIKNRFYSNLVKRDSTPAHLKTACATTKKQAKVASSPSHKSSRAGRKSKPTRFVSEEDDEEEDEELAKEMEREMEEQDKKEQKEKEKKMKRVPRVRMTKPSVQPKNKNKKVGMGEKHSEAEEGDPEEPMLEIEFVDQMEEEDEDEGVLSSSFSDTDQEVEEERDVPHSPQPPSSRKRSRTHSNDFSSLPRPPKKRRVALVKAHAPQPQQEQNRSGSFSSFRDFLDVHSPSSSLASAVVASEVLASFAPSVRPDVPANPPPSTNWHDEIVRDPEGALACIRKTWQKAIQDDRELAGFEAVLGLLDSPNKRQQDSDGVPRSLEMEAIGTLQALKHEQQQQVQGNSKGAGLCEGATPLPCSEEWSLYVNERHID